jgi:hypothetical protein
MGPRPASPRSHRLATRLDDASPRLICQRRHRHSPRPSPVVRPSTPRQPPPSPHAGRSPPQPSPRSLVSLGPRTNSDGLSGCPHPVLLAGLQHHGHVYLLPTPSLVSLSNQSTSLPPSHAASPSFFRPMSTLLRPPPQSSILCNQSNFLPPSHAASPSFRPITPLSRFFIPILRCYFHFT